MNKVLQTIPSGKLIKVHQKVSPTPYCLRHIPITPNQSCSGTQITQTVVEESGSDKSDR